MRERKLKSDDWAEKAELTVASRSLNVLKIDSPSHRKCRELLIAAD